MRHIIHFNLITLRFFKHLLSQNYRKITLLCIYLGLCCQFREQKKKMLSLQSNHSLYNLCLVDVMSLHPFSLLLFRHLTLPFLLTKAGLSQESAVMPSASSLLLSYSLLPSSVSLQTSIPLVFTHLSSALYMPFSLLKNFYVLLLQHFCLNTHMKSFYHSCDVLFLLPADFRDKCL